MFIDDRDLSWERYEVQGEWMTTVTHTRTGAQGTGEDQREAYSALLRATSRL